VQAGLADRSVEVCAGGNLASRACDEVARAKRRVQRCRTAHDSLRMPHVRSAAEISTGAAMAMQSVRRAKHRW